MASGMMWIVNRGPKRGKYGIQVEGGVVVVDINRGSSSFATWCKAIGLMFLRGGYTNRGVKRDIVIQNASRTQELYREGPYDGITVNFRLRRLVGEIEKMGLDGFLRVQHIENDQLGPINAPPEYLGVDKIVASYYWQAFKGVFRRKRDK